MGEEPASRKHRPDPAAAKFRAEGLRRIRDFFERRGVLEVETPVLSRGISLDSHIDVFSAEYFSAGYPRPEPGDPASAPEIFFLQTSPEPHMKRLLCSGFPDIYQIGKAFRNGERGNRHNPEFTMLEWYRRDFTLMQLMDETAELCALVAGSRPVVRKTYREAFREVLSVDPLDAKLDLPALSELAVGRARAPAGHGFPSRADALDFLMAHAVEPAFAPDALTLLRDFPSDQAAQARVRGEDSRLVERFEIYGGGMELGNGYLELLDPREYERRFDAENAKRRSLGKPQLPKDSALMDDLRGGLPPCAGVAVGLDRLLMLGLGRSSIGSVLSFPWEFC